MSGDDDEDGFREYGTDVLPGRIKTVRIYDSTKEHIKEEHPEVPIELPSLEHAVEKAITDPSHVEKGGEKSYVFVDTNSTNRSGHPFRLPVVVVADVDQAGRVATGFFGTKEGPVEKVYERSTDDSE